MATITHLENIRNISYGLLPMENEIWKPIEGTPYEISSQGVLRNKTTNRLLKYSINGGYYSYPYLTHFKKSHRIHRQVAITFIPNPENKPTVNHKDGNKLNNCVENLEWSTYSENLQHAFDTGLKTMTPDVNLRISEAKAHTKKIVEQYNRVGELLNTFPSIRDAAKATGIKPPNISACARGVEFNKTAGGFIWKFK